MTKEEERKLYARYLKYAKKIKDPYLKHAFEQTILGNPDKYEIEDYEDMEYKEDFNFMGLRIVEIEEEELSEEEKLEEERKAIYDVWKKMKEEQQNK